MSASVNNRFTDLLLTIATDLETALGEALTSENRSILAGVRRAVRRFDHLFWKTEPEFLRRP